MNNTTTASVPVTVNAAEKPIETQKEEIVKKIMDLAKDPTNNAAELAQLATKYDELDKLDAAQKTEAKKQEEAIQWEKVEEHKEEMAEATQQANQEKIMKMDELTNLLQDKPENAEKNAELIVEQSKTRIKQTIERYLAKIQELKTANETEKKKIIKELEDVKTELKKEKDNYENAKNYFMGKLDYKPENLGKISTKRIRFGKKTVKWGIMSWTPIETLQFSTIRRRMTVNKLIDKFNRIGNDPVKGVRFIMGFEKPRFLRYTEIKVVSGINQLGEKIGMQINPENFHKQFNTGRNNIMTILEKGERTPEEQKVIDAIKKRINYYGYAYARQRASAWTDPFLQAEKWAKKEDKILESNQTEAKIVKMNISEKEENLSKTA